MASPDAAVTKIYALVGRSERAEYFRVIAANASADETVDDASFNAVYASARWSSFAEFNPTEVCTVESILAHGFATPANRPTDSRVVGQGLRERDKSVNCKDSGLTRHRGGVRNAFSGNLCAPHARISYVEQGTRVSGGSSN